MSVIDDELPVEQPEASESEDGGSDAPVAESRAVAATAESAPSVAGSGEMEWFVLKVQSNREKSIRDSLLRRIKREGLEDRFGEVIIPTEKVKETKAGKTRVMERKLYPGYIMIHMVLDDETWYLVRDTSGVGDFTGAAGKPIAMRVEEIDRMLGRQIDSVVEPAKIKIDLAPGDAVKIKEGTFESFEGTIDKIDEEHGKITVLIEIFSRSTPVELEYWQVEKV
ncbi:MAG: transcription termination/antitermination protein NusG [Planctomycetaceae bacterium]